MRLRALSFVLLAGLSLVLAAGPPGCNTLRVRSDFDPEADFSSLATWAWQRRAQPETGDPRLDSSLLDTRVRRAVEAALAAKGFEKASNAEPDFLVGYYTAIEGRLEVQTLEDYSADGWGWGPGMGSAAGGWRSVPETTIREYDEGTLIIDVSQPRSEQLMWRGSGKREIDDRRTPEQRDADMVETVAKILASFPPQTQ